MFDKRLFCLIYCFSLLILKAQNFGDSFPVLTFDQDTADFGIVEEGDTVSFDFWFTNTGNKDLVIKQAWPACGCTKPSYTQGVIKPGQRGMIHVEFHSQGWGGHSMVKEIIVILGNGPENYARFKVKVVNSTFKKELDTYKKSMENKSKPAKGKKKRRKT